MILTPVLRILGGNSHFINSVVFLKHLFLYAILSSTNTHQNSKIYPINIKRTIYISKTQINRLPYV